MKSIVRSLAALAVLGTAMAAPVLAADKARERVISVSASASVTAEADLAVISMGVVTESKSAREALDENSRTMTKVINGLKNSGIKSQDIATQNFNVTPIYNRRKASSSRSAPDGITFRVTNMAQVTVRRITQLGELIDKAAGLGANRINGVQFIVSNMDQKLDAARREATRNAIRRATLYAQAAGARLGEVLTISETAHGRPVHHQVRARTSAASFAAPIEPGRQNLRVTIHASWKLE